MRTGRFRLRPAIQGNRPTPERPGLRVLPAAGGLSKLEQAATEVDALQTELTQARVVVKAATEECNQLLEVRA